MSFLTHETVERWPWFRTPAALPLPPMNGLGCSYGTGSERSGRPSVAANIHFYFIIDIIRSLRLI